MSNVKVNGNTYNDVTSVKLALADGTGYATYSEGAVTDNVTNSILDGSLSGDYTNDEILTVNMGCFNSLASDGTLGTLSFPNAVKWQGAFGGYADNILLPKVSAFSGVPNFRSCKVSDVIDLSGMVAIVGMNQTFYGATIGTLKIGKMLQHNDCFQNATIGALVWNIETWNDQIIQQLKRATSITDLYITDDYYDTVSAAIADGTLTTVTNLHKISEWSDD